MVETTQFNDNPNPDRTPNIEGALKPNTILMNRYKILGILGGGGQGAVYSARDMKFEAKRLVAVKEMRYQSNDPNMRTTLSTFEREANILAALTHPTIPKIYDYFDNPDNRVYLVMEFINGSDLEALLAKTKELPLDKIIEWAIDLCDVLHYLHNLPEPIIFRDMKPANIMIDSLGKVRLIDFGIAKIFVSGVKNTMIGTEGYSAPEQYKGDVTPLSDVYGLGATLHHILTRKDPRIEQPFSFSERPIKDFNPSLPDFLQTILDRALSMDPRQRYQSCEEMRQDFVALRAGSGSKSPNIQSGGAYKDTSFFDDASNATVTGGSYGPKWTFKTEDEIRSGVATYRDKVLIGSYDTNLWAVSATDGEFLWKYATKGGVASTPVVDKKNGLVLFGSEDQKFYAIDIETGRDSWMQNTNGQIRSSPFLAHNHVFFGNDAGHLFAYSVGGGRLQWERDLGSEIRTRPFVTNTNVIASTESGELWSFDLSGTKKWNVDVSKRGRQLSSSPYVDETEGICYVGCFDGYLYAVDAGNGYGVWRFRTGQPIISSVAVDSGIVYFGSADGNLYAVHSDNAREKWRFHTEKPIVGTPIFHRNKIYFGGTDGIFYCLDAKNGKETWRYETGGPITATPHIMDDNLVLIGSMDYTLYAFPLVI